MVKRVAPHWLLLSAALALGGAARARAQTAVLTTTAPPAADDEDTPVCKSELRLSGAVYDAARPERSMALVQLRPNQPATLARVGAQLGAFELVAIEPRGVLLRNADGECWLRLVGDPIARAQRKTAPPARAASKDDKKKKKKKSEVVVIGRR